jgi:flagella basal body P-ring formation protein FlgA
MLDQRLAIATLFILVAPRVAWSQSNQTIGVSVVLSLRESVEISTSEAFLDDVADCRCSEPAECDAIGGIRLVQNMMPGVVSRWDRRALETLIQQEAKNVKVDWVGRDAVEVRSSSNLILQTEIEKLLESRLQSIASGWQRMRYSIRRVRIYDRLLSRDKEFELLIPALDHDPEAAIQVLSESIGAWLIVDAIIQDQEWSQPFKLHAQIELEVLAPVAARSLNRGEIIQKGDITSRWVKSNRFMVTEIPTALELEGRELTRALKGGDVIRRSAAKAQQVIARGKLVRVRMGANGVSLSSEAKAMQSGGVGDEIEIQVVPTKKRLWARIIDAETVEGKM